jgi:hypothetical protein
MADDQTRVFLSYRRSDTKALSRLIYESLIARFGKDNVFFDVDSMPVGADFYAHIAEQVAKCSVLLAVIGDQWSQGDVFGNADFVRIEVRSALALGIPVVPLFAEGAKPPSLKEVPADLQPLLKRNGLPVDSGRDFRNHMESVAAHAELLSKQHLARRREEPRGGSSLQFVAIPEGPVAGKPNRRIFAFGHWLGTVATRTWHRFPSSVIGAAAAATLIPALLLMRVGSQRVSVTAVTSVVGVKAEGNRRLSLSRLREMQHATFSQMNVVETPSECLRAASHSQSVTLSVNSTPGTLSLGDLDLLAGDRLALGAGDQFEVGQLRLRPSSNQTSPYCSTNLRYASGQAETEGEPTTQPVALSVELPAHGQTEVMTDPAGAPCILNDRSSLEVRGARGLTIQTKGSMPSEGVELLDAPLSISCIDLQKTVEEDVAGVREQSVVSGISNAEVEFVDLNTVVRVGKGERLRLVLTNGEIARLVARAPNVYVQLRGTATVVAGGKQNDNLMPTYIDVVRSSAGVASWWGAVALLLPILLDGMRLSRRSAEKS